MQDGLRLDGKTLVVTGGAGHIGSELTLGLAALGATVVACDRRPEALDALLLRAQAGGLGDAVVPVAADVAGEDGVRATLDAVAARGLRPDGWVNGAAASRPSLWPGLEAEAVRATVEGALTATMLATGLAAERMREDGGGGSIVSVASMYGLVAPQPAAYAAHPRYHSPPAYGAAKAGLLQFTRYMAVHLAPHGIRVNAVSPGAFPVPAVQADEAFVAELAARTPLGRIGRPQELVGPVAFLLSDASSFVTGHDLVVDGGWTVW